MRRTSVLIATAIVIGLGYWLTRPPNDLALDDACGLSDVQARASALIYGTKFWLAQRDAVDRELDALRGMTASEGLTDRGPVNDTESQMTRLSDASKSPEALEREHRQIFAEMGHLTVCRAAIEKNL